MAQTNVINIEERRGRRPKAYQISDDVMNEIRLRLYEWSPKDAAEACGVSLGCIYAIRRGTTKWPRPHTFFAILELVDVEMRLYDRRQKRYL